MVRHSCSWLACFSVLFLAALTNAPRVAASTNIQSVVCQAPTMPIITEPTDKSQTFQSSITVTGRATPGNTITITDNNQNVGFVGVASDGSFGLEIPLTIGRNPLQATVANPCGVTILSSVTTITRNLLTAALPPAAQPNLPFITGIQPSAVGYLAPPVRPVITSPKSGAVVTTRQLWLRGRATPGTRLTILLNSSMAAQLQVSADGSFAVLLSLLPGKNTIVVISNLGNQNSGSQTIDVTYNPEPGSGVQALSFSWTVLGIWLLLSGVGLVGSIMYKAHLASLMRKKHAPSEDS